MSEHPSGVETRKVAQGWSAVYHHGDGTCTKSWGVTPRQASQSVLGEVNDE